MNTPDTRQNSEPSFRFDEKYLSQLSALQVLVNLGCQYLTPAEALAGQRRLPIPKETEVVADA